MEKYYYMWQWKWLQNAETYKKEMFLRKLAAS